MSGNKNLRKANKNKKDEFYTQLVDIEKEMRYYKDYFYNKIIFCNCDDPYESNFFKYFALNFNFLGLKKLIATCYESSPIIQTELNLFGDIINETIIDNGCKAYKIEISEVKSSKGDNNIDLSDVEYLLRNDKNILTELSGDGDFRSDESIELLKTSDIVVTNPPFSLFREYIAQLEEYNKKFIIIGNTNALTYKETFKLIKENRLRTGYTNFNVGMYFFVPEYSEKYHKIEDGKRMVRVSTSCWFTNLPVKKHNEFIVLYRKYNPEDYPKYDNYNAININKVADIPYDYNGYMGVPITFVDKYNPEQFEIIDALNRYSLLDIQDTNSKVKELHSHTCNIKGKATYFRIVIKRKEV